MEMDQKEVDRILSPLVSSIVPLYQQDVLQPSSEDFWAARAAQTFCSGEQLDRGIFSIYFFNLLHLKKGEGIFQRAGLPHAYLEGQNVEIMSNSDNVLRAGLTTKYVDVPELLGQVIFEPTHPQIIPASKAAHQVYHSPAEEFELHSYHLEKDVEEKINSRTAEIFLVTEGAVSIGSGRKAIEATKGQAFLVMAGSEILLKALKNAEVFRATVPVDKN